MRQKHLDLQDHFESLRRDNKDRHVYFLEHGLDAEDIETLFAQVSRACAVDPFSSSSWSDRYLPLLVAATEVGYAYQGPGRDFWPTLDARLGISSRVEDRRALADLFRLGAKQLGGVTPPGTPWALHFPYIAWPITHAVFPVEFHRPLARALAKLKHRHLDPGDDEALTQALGYASLDLGGARFKAALADRSLMRTIARHFLRVENVNPAVDEAVLERVTKDLRRDEVAARDVDLAYRQRRQALADTAQRQVGVKKEKPVSTLLGRLHLRLDDDELTLEASFPQPASELIRLARRALRRRRYAPRLWGLSARVPSDQLLAGLPFRVGSVESLASLAGRSLLPGLDTLEVDRAVKAHLERLSLDLSTPLLFQARADGRSAFQLRGGGATAGGIYWLLTDPSVSAGPGVTPLGKLGGLQCVRLDTQYEGAQRLLTAAGVSLRFAVSAHWVGDPADSMDPERRTFRPGDAVAVEVSRIPPDGVKLVAPGESPQRVREQALVRLSSELGQRSLEVSAQGKSQTLSYQVAASSAPLELCWITLEGDEPSLQSLLGRTLALKIDGIAPIDGATLTLTVASGGFSQTVSQVLPALPALIGPAHSLWGRLIPERTREALSSSPSATLRAVVGGLALQEWHLEPRLRPIWWRGEGHRRRLVSEQGEVPFGVVSALDPTAPPEPAGEVRQEAVLLVPMALNSDQFGPTAPFTCLFEPPKSFDLQLPKIVRPRSLRSRHSGEHGLGAEELIAAFLRWRLAETSSALGRLRQGQIAHELERWLIRSVCGDSWADAEGALGAQMISPWEALIDQCHRLKVGFDERVELSPEEEAALGRIAVEQLRASCPGLWLDALGAARPEALYETLDMSFGRAYELLADAQRAAGRFWAAWRIEEGDPGSAPEDWDQALTQAQLAAQMTALAELVYPTSGGVELLQLDYAHLNFDELVDELAGWRRRHKAGLQGRAWERDELEAGLALWLAPERTLRTPWRTASERLITDRSTSRAIRYAALRRRSALASLSPVEGDSP